MVSFAFQIQPATKFDDEVMEDEHVYEEVKNPHISNAGVNQFSVDQPMVSVEFANGIGSQDV